MNKALNKDIEGCKKQESKSQLKLYNRYANTIMAVCYRYMGNDFKAQDMLQESFVKIFQKIEMYNSEGNFEAWIRRIAVNTCLDQLRKDKKERQNVQIEEELVGAIDSGILEEMAAEDIMDIVMEMPEGYRTVFNLYAVEGYSHKEIADKLNVSENTSKSQYSRAKKFLRDRLEELNIIDIRS
jgi:RNA polymerase sigma factor (sigma-70 family)